MAEPDDLVYQSREPLNAEVRLDRIAGLITPAGQHYVRDHFPIPGPVERVDVSGAVEAPRQFTLDELRALPARTLMVTLECAGNGRAFLDPPAPGEQWRQGAVGTAEWTGVPLRSVLEQVRPRREAIEVLFIGADRGTPKDLGREISYERSLPLADAMRDEVLLAYAMNAEPLPPEHGAPLRLIVPGWYGMASVKWLAKISVIGRAFDGFYQKDRYVIDGQPLREIAPRAVVTFPGDGARLPRAPFVARGRAWTGRGSIARVLVSTDGGRSWREAVLETATSTYAWRVWSIDVDPGDAREISVVARAVTATGESQSLEQVRNALGYANNAARPVRVHIE